MSRRRVFVLLGAMMLVGGCNRQDADCLARIGDLLSKRAQALKEKTTANSKLPRSVPDLRLVDPTVAPGNVNGEPDPDK